MTHGAPIQKTCFCQYSGSGRVVRKRQISLLANNLFTIANQWFSTSLTLVVFTFQLAVEMNTVCKTQIIMLSSWLCLAFAILETFIYAGVSFGFGFLQYIFEKEQVFWDDVCYDPNIHTNCSKPQGKILKYFNVLIKK